MQDPQDSDETRTPIVFEVRHVPITPTAQIPAVLQYVRAALDTVGCGSVYPTPTGLQITAPVELLVHLLATINDYKGLDLSDVFQFGVVLYKPAVTLVADPDSAVDVVKRLGLCPREMNVAVASYTGQKAIVFSGPKDREAFFKSNILPSLKALFGAGPPS